MSVEIVRNYFKENSIDKEILEFPVSSATVELAAQAVGVEPARIAKTLSFYTKEKDAAILIVTAGDMKIDNSKFKQFFGMKAKMLAPEDVEPLTGPASCINVRGICPGVSLLDKYLVILFFQYTADTFKSKHTSG